MLNACVSVITAPILICPSLTPPLTHLLVPHHQQPLPCHLVLEQIPEGNPGVFKSYDKSSGVTLRGNKVCTGKKTLRGTWSSLGHPTMYL